MNIKNKNGSKNRKDLVSSLRKLFLPFFVLFSSSYISNSYAETISLTTYFSAPQGSYDVLKLKPRANKLEDDYQAMVPPRNCENVTLYIYAADNEIYTCDETNLSKKLGAIWAETTQAINPAIGKAGDIYLINWEDRNLNVGIGTTTPEFKLTINKGGILAYGATLPAGTPAVLPANADGYGRKFIWFAPKANLIVGESRGSKWDNANLDPDMTDTVTMGYDSTLASKKSIIFGGASHHITTRDSAANAVEGNVIGGGKSNGLYYKDNNERADMSVIAGGKLNLIYNDYSFIGGGGVTDTGVGNKIYSDFSVIMGGESNLIDEFGSSFSVIGGGTRNLVNSKHYALLGGVTNNQGIVNTGNYATILGGAYNKTESDYNVIASGYINHTKTTQNTILGGWQNTSQKSQSTIGNGYSNFIGETDGTVLTGLNNAINDPQDSASGSVIAAGNNNQVHQKRSVITNGLQNASSGDYSAIWNGWFNQVHGDISAIGNGIYNCIGFTSNAGVTCSSGGIDMSDNFIPNGVRNNIFRANYSFVGGQNMKIDGTSVGMIDRSFVWGNSATPVTLTASNAFMIRSSVVGIGVANPDATQAKLHVNGNFNLEGALYLSSLPLPTTGNPIEIDTTAAGKGRIGCNGACDLAENFETSEEVEVGDLVVIDKDNHLKLKKSTSPYDKKVIGIVSGNPAIVFEGSQLKVAPKPHEFKKGTNPPVALAGRVPCKVSLENGAIEEGDLLTSSSIPGHVMKATDIDKAYNSVVGKALQPFTGGPQGEKTGTIIVMVTK